MPKIIKVCHIAHGDLWAGAEVQLATLLEALAQDPTWKLSAILLNDGRLAREIKALGIPVTIVSEDRHNALALLLKITALLRRLRPHIVHTHKYKDNILGALAAAVVRVPAVVRSVHGMTEPFRGKAYVKMLGYEFVDHLITLTRVTKMIAVSSNIRALLEKRYGGGKVVQIHNGVSLEKIRPTMERDTLRKTIGVRKDDYIIGTVGRLTPVKGHDILLRAGCSIMKTIPNTKVLLVGDGPLMSTLKRLTHQLGIEKDVILAGHREDVYDLVNCMDVFALPSLHEGIPMGLLEAMALSCPVIATCVGGIPEVVKHGEDGLLVAPGNVTELEQGIDLMLRDRPYAMRLGRAGRTRIQSEFSAMVMAQRTAHLYASFGLQHKDAQHES
jgi:glycosyltransferase involved in cell wall biosynthesis